MIHVLFFPTWHCCAKREPAAVGPHTAVMRELQKVVSQTFPSVLGSVGCESGVRRWFCCFSFRFALLEAPPPLRPCDRASLVGEAEGAVVREADECGEQGLHCSSVANPADDSIPLLSEHQLVFLASLF